MPRILIAECKQEVSTFNPHLSGYDDFGIRRGQGLLDYHRTVRNEVGGALSVFDTMPEVELLPAYSAFFITSGGTLAKAAWERIATEMLEAIRASPPADGVYFCMQARWRLIGNSFRRCRPGVAQHAHRRWGRRGVCSRKVAGGLDRPGFFSDIGMECFRRGQIWQSWRAPPSNPFPAVKKQAAFWSWA